MPPISATQLLLGETPASPTYHSHIGQPHSKCHILRHMETKHRIYRYILGEMKNQCVICFHANMREQYETKLLIRYTNSTNFRGAVKDKIEIRYTI